MGKIVLVSGRLHTGKSGLARLLVSELGFVCLKTSDMLRQIAIDRAVSASRVALQELGDRVDTESEGRWIYNAVKATLSEEPDASIVVDNIRNAKQLEVFREDHSLNLLHVHLYATNEELEKRFRERQQRPDAESADYPTLDLIKSTVDIEVFKDDADVRINTARTDTRDTFVRVAARLGVYSPPDVRCVDVIVGGQYGSEGKGHIAAYLAKDYDYLLRVGGPNAGHTVSSSSGIYIYHQLPSGARDTNAKLLLGPGMTIDPEKLLQEIADCKISPERLFIDPQAMIIEKSDISGEGELVAKIASTGRGSGNAAARRILNRNRGEVKVRLAKDLPELAPYVGDGAPYRGSTTDRLEEAYRNGASILLEGTQGSALSIYHGTYPYVTSRDTNVAGCIAEAGISPSRIRKILMVIRATPIRVGNPDGESGETSGPLKHEVDLETVASAAGLDLKELQQYEKTSTTKRKRRIGWFEWEQFRQACALNAPTDIVLTFADYLTVENRKARRFEQLHRDTIKFIEELERVAQAPVSLINTRFQREEEDVPLDLRSVIDRRNWKTRRSAQAGIE